jgi:hypothetical protein
MRQPDARRSRGVNAVPGAPRPESPEPPLATHVQAGARWRGKAEPVFRECSLNCGGSIGERRRGKFLRWANKARWERDGRERRIPNARSRREFTRDIPTGTRWRGKAEPVLGERSVNFGGSSVSGLGESPAVAQQTLLAASRPATPDTQRSVPKEDRVASSRLRLACYRVSLA